MNKKYYNHFCNNCGKTGHLFQNCKKPIISTGIINFKKDNENIYFLLICRKDTLGYVDFLRGKYSLNDKTQLLNLFNEMTVIEKQKIINNNFNFLWSELWGNFVGNQYKSEEKKSKEKFNKLKNNDMENLNLDILIKESHTKWDTPEWGFPKGRRNNGENDINCAIREYMEETGHPKQSFEIIQNILPFEEIFTGSNYKSYKHKYYLAVNKKNVSNEYFQKSEVSDMKWLTLEESLKRIRPYSFEKIEIIKKIDKLLNKYSLLV
jgi:8-oxo-dGTP pyrophosphatase MutT (NUDIX family)